MKKIINIIVLICLFSCKEHSTKSDLLNMEILPEAADFKTIETAENFSIQKLEEALELIHLKQQHPEFAHEINQQLLNFTSDTTTFNYPSSFRIANIKQVGNTKTSDSLDLLKLSFTVISGSNHYQDSVYAAISKHQINMDGTIQTSRQIRFSNID